MELNEKNGELWFNYLVENNQYWCNGFTIKRLNTVKNSVLNDKNIMRDLLIRHNAKDLTPEQMQKNKLQFEHCIGNFVAQIREKMIELKILK